MNDELFKTQRPAEIAPEYSEMLFRCSGFRVGYVEVLFTEYRTQGFEFLLPDWFEVCADGCGNFWTLEIDRARPWGPVWFICHDPPTMTLVSRTLAEFIELVVDCHRQRKKMTANAFAQSHEMAMRVWKAERRGTPVLNCRGSNDPILARFCEGLPHDARVIDFRGCNPGEGFCWDDLDWTTRVTLCEDDPMLRANVGQPAE